MAGVALVLIVLLLGGEIVARSVFNHSFPFSWEYASYLLSIMIFGGLGWTLRTGGHIRVTVLEAFLSPTRYRAVSLIASLIAAVLASALAWGMTWLCWKSLIDQSRSFLPSETLLYIPQLFIALGAIGFAAQAWLRLYLLAAGEPVEIDADAANSAQSHI